MLGVVGEQRLRQLEHLDDIGLPVRLGAQGPIVWDGFHAFRPPTRWSDPPAQVVADGAPIIGGVDRLRRVRAAAARAWRIAMKYCVGVALATDWGDDDDDGSLDRRLTLVALVLIPGRAR